MLICVRTIGLRDDFFIGYADPDFPSDKYFIYQINRALLAASQSSLVEYGNDFTFTPGKDVNAVIPIDYSPATAVGSINQLIESTPMDNFSRPTKKSYKNMLCRIKCLVQTMNWSSVVHWVILIFLCFL